MNVYLECSGTQVGIFTIDKFQLHPGEVISLIWPANKGHFIEPELQRVLTGKSNDPAINIYGTVMYVERPRIQPTFIHSVLLAKLIKQIAPRAYSHRPDFSSVWGSIIQYSDKREVLTHSKIRSLRQSIGKSADGDIKTLGHQNYLEIGLERAFQSADIVVFDTFGSNVKRAYEVVRKWVDQGRSAVEISYPHFDIFNPDRDTFPDARKIEVDGWQPGAALKSPKRTDVANMYYSLLDHRLSRPDVASWALQVWDTASPWEDRDLLKAVATLAGSNKLNPDTGDLIFDDNYLKMRLETITSC